MNVTRLRYLTAVADLGTVTAAAESLHVAQPAVSRAIQRLERELGVKLFVHRGRGIELSDAGRRLVDQARRVIAEADVFAEMARAEHDTGHTRLVIATTPTLEHLAVTKLLRMVRDAQLELRVSIRTVADPVAVGELVMSGDADLGVTDHPPPAPLCTMPLFDEEAVVACPPGSPTGPIAATDLGNVPLVLPAQGTRRRAQVDAFLASHGVVASVAVETNDRASWLEYVITGVGSAFRYRSQVEAVQDRGVVLRSFQPPSWRHIALLYRPDDRSPAACQLLEVMGGTD